MAILSFADIAAALIGFGDSFMTPHVARVTICGHAMRVTLMSKMWRKTSLKCHKIDLLAAPTQIARGHYEICARLLS
ncbi:MAG: hypothetical protein KGM18_02675 [Sphingomonadales bacterium]|nr:hypothetical protein [Sphingomonadales bacterium]